MSWGSNNAYTHKYLLHTSCENRCVLQNKINTLRFHINLCACMQYQFQFSNILWLYRKIDSIWSKHIDIILWNDPNSMQIHTLYKTIKTSFFFFFFFLKRKKWNETTSLQWKSLAEHKTYTKYLTLFFFLSFQNAASCIIIIIIYA